MAVQGKPEPQPSVVGGKSPGQVLYETLKQHQGCRAWLDWVQLTTPSKDTYETVASAVLAAFGNQSLDAARDGQAEVVQAQLIAEHTPLTADQWAERWQQEADARNAQFKELQNRKAEVVDWKARYEEAQKEIELLKKTPLRQRCQELEREVNHWCDLHTVANSRAEKAEAELAQSEAAFSNYRGFILSALNEAGAPTHHKDVGAPALKPMTPQERIKALPKLPQLRPLSEAGPVPEGCVRVFTNSDYGNASEYQHSGRTHFADIFLPAPAEKVEPETFEAHGKTWTKHTPGDAMPCEENRLVELIEEREVDGKYSKYVDHAATFVWSAAVGWRYADGPTPEPLEPEPWTPQVGDVVRLKSGGPLMTVTMLAIQPHNDVRCVYIQGSTQVCIVPTACLEPATK